MSYLYTPQKPATIGFERVLVNGRLLKQSKLSIKNIRNADLTGFLNFCQIGIF